MLNLLKKWRRDLHQIPEIGFKEYKTAHYLYNELTSMGYDVQYITETGLIVFIDYHQESTIAFRSDIDALKITEENDIDFKSQHEGYMHACGHDGHMSALLGLAYKLKDEKQLNHNILLIFQPGEEISRGSRNIIDTGIFEKYRVKAIFGMHMFPDVEEGYIASRKGPLMAQSGELDVVIKGKSAHAGKYYEGIDTILIASQLIQQYQSIVSRLVSPMQPVILHIGCMCGGTVRNIVAGQSEFHGTVRTYNEEVFDTIKKAIININQGMENTYGCSIDCSLISHNPPVLNDGYYNEQIKSLLKDKYLELEEPVMLAEDFSHYQKVVPGVFFFVGTKCKEYCSGLHTSTFQFHEEVLMNAVDLYYDLASTL